MPVALDFSNELTHHGILGMKWGVRRYQNKDGSLTAAGKKHVGSSDEAPVPKRKRLRDYTDDELKERTARLQTEKNYFDARKNATDSRRNYIESERNLKSTKNNRAVTEKKPVSEMTDSEIKRALERKKLEEDYEKAFPRQLSNGEKFVNATKSVVVDFAKTKGKQIAYDFVEKKAKEYLGLSKEEVNSAKKTYEKLKLEADTLNQRKLIKEYTEALNGKKDDGDESKKLQKEAQDYENRTKIDRGQKYFKEGRYEEAEPEPEAKTREELMKLVKDVRAKRSTRSVVKHGEEWAEDFFLKANMIFYPITE